MTEPKSQEIPSTPDDLQKARSVAKELEEQRNMEFNSKYLVYLQTEDPKLFAQFVELEDVEGSDRVRKLNSFRKDLEKSVNTYEMEEWERAYSRMNMSDDELKRMLTFLSGARMGKPYDGPNRRQEYSSSFENDKRIAKYILKRHATKSEIMALYKQEVERGGKGVDVMKECTEFIMVKGPHFIELRKAERERHAARERKKAQANAKEREQEAFKLKNKKEALLQIIKYEFEKPELDEFPVSMEIIDKFEKKLPDQFTQLINWYHKPEGLDFKLALNNLYVFVDENKLTVPREKKPVAKRRKATPRKKARPTPPVKTARRVEKAAPAAAPAVAEAAEAPTPAEPASAEAAAEVAPVAAAEAAPVPPVAAEMAEKERATVEFDDRSKFTGTWRDEIPARGVYEDTDGNRSNELVFTNWGKAEGMLDGKDYVFNWDVARGLLVAREKTIESASLDEFLEETGTPRPEEVMAEYRRLCDSFETNSKKFFDNSILIGKDLERNIGYVQFLSDLELDPKYLDAWLEWEAEMKWAFQDLPDYEFDANIRSIEGKEYIGVNISFKLEETPRIVAERTRVEKELEDNEKAFAKLEKKRARRKKPSERIERKYQEINDAMIALNDSEAVKSNYFVRKRVNEFLMKESTALAEVRDIESKQDEAIAENEKGKGPEEEKET